MRARLDVHGLTKTLGGIPVLRGVEFSLDPGSLVAILGASGSGKSTLLRLIAGFEQPDAGEILLGGEVIASPVIFQKPERRFIGYVAQEGALFPHLSVAGNIAFGLGRAQRRDRHRVSELLHLVGLPADYAQRAPQSLSGGEQQRVAVARALAPNPRLILLDEPFSALDAALREETRAAVAAALAAAGATAILVTHDQAEALSLGSRVGVLQDGTLRQLSEPQKLYHRPLDAALANFVGDAVFTPGFAEGGEAQCALGRLRLAADAPEGHVNIMIRPEQIKIMPDANHGGCRARIEQVIFYGHDAMVRLSLATAPRADITARVFSHNLPTQGKEVWLLVEGDVAAYRAPEKIQNNNAG